MWSELRADAALRELGGLSRTEVGVDELHAAALAVVARVVPFDAACVGAVDPETMLLTSGLTLGFAPGPAESERFVEIEYGGADPNSFLELVERRVAVVADAGGVAPARRNDLRYNELTKLIGFAHDVRIACTVEGTCWAVGDLYRDGVGSSFEARELEFLERAAALVAVATRSVSRRAGADPSGLPDGSAVMVVEADGAVSGMTSAALAWLAADEPRAVDPALWWGIRTAVATARRGVPTAHARVQARGGWVVVRASALRPDVVSAPVAVTIDVAGARDLVDVLMAAHGMTRREREICHELLAGRSTREIAARLAISPHTVQDHLKSIFDKVGVRSRRELVASLGS